MKKLFNWVLTIISVCLVAVFLPHFSASAQESPSPVKTDVFLPSSYLQLYDLKSPLSISYSDNGYMVISEHISDGNGGSTFDRISIYNPHTESFGAIAPHETIFNVTHATEWQDYVFYLSNSKLYYVDAEILDGKPTESPITSSTFFHIKDNYLLTNTNNSIVIYEMQITNNEIGFIKKSTHNFTTKNAFISSDGNVYYLYGGKLYCFDTSSSTSYVVATVSVDVNYMVEYENFVYFSSNTGIYRVEKSKNSDVNKVLATDDVSTLGHFNNPQGLTVMDGQILIADPNLKCVQAIKPETGKFTDFAITVESTADFRLTNNATKLSVSENYAFVLDDGAFDEFGNSYKRLVKIALDKNSSNRYASISLKSLYGENGEFNLKYFACSDTHVAIYQDKTLTVYEISENTLVKVYSIESESITSLSYLDNEFYYTSYSLYNFEYNVVNVNKIIFPSEDNNVNEITNKKIEFDGEIKGTATNACVDVFGNVYLLNDPASSSEVALLKIGDGKVEEITKLNGSIVSIKADFGGNVYLLDNEGKIYKYSRVGNQTTKTVYKFDSTPIKDIELNYTSNVCYALSNSSILISKNNEMQIENLSQVSANGLDASSILTDVKFVSLSNNAKIFKVSINDLDSFNNFKNITPVSNPDSSKVYLIISELDNYYLISYSEKFVALVSKPMATYTPGSNYNATLISKEFLQNFNVEVVDETEKSFIISNDTAVFAKPIFDKNYKISTLSKGDEVVAVKTIKFNQTSLTLIKDTSNKLLGYVVSGYLTSEPTVNHNSTEEVINITTKNGDKHFNTVLMITIIAFTVTLTLLFIEKKLLFDKEDNNAKN